MSWKRFAFEMIRGFKDEALLITEMRSLVIRFTAQYVKGCREKLDYRTVSHKVLCIQNNIKSDIRNKKHVKNDLIN